MTLPGPQLPWPAARRPLSIVAFGNSVASMQIPLRSDRAEGTYAEVLADLLGADGVPAVVHLESRWFEFLHRAMRHYEQRVRAHSPDVLLVQFGLNEYQPWLVPVWLVRHLLVQGEAVVRPARAYRARVADPAWKQVRGLRRRIAPAVGLRTWQVTPQRFGGPLRRLLRLARGESQSLVLVLDIDRPGQRLEHFLPGMAERHAVFQRTIEQVVRERDDPEVRLVRVSEITEKLGPGALVDEMHYSTA